MENVVQINKDVNVVAYYFKDAGRRLKCFPKRIEYEGKSITFSDMGLRHPTKKGQRMIHVFNMTDGNADYCLEFDAQGLNWTLISVADMSEQPAGVNYRQSLITA